MTVMNQGAFFLSSVFRFYGGSGGDELVVVLVVVVVVYARGRFRTEYG